MNKLTSPQFRDYCSSFILLALGLASAYHAQSYQIGSFTRMGPGFFPLALGLILALTGTMLLGATFLRNDPEWSSRVVYFGPMGCRTGFYLVLFGKYESADVIDLVTRAFEFARDFEDEIPGAPPPECGNWHAADLNAAHWWARRYLEQTLYKIDDAHMTYPQG